MIITWVAIALVAYLLDSWEPRREELTGGRCLRG
jgi:hypothetical protein